MERFHRDHWSLVVAAGALFESYSLSCYIKGVWSGLKNPWLPEAWRGSTLSSPPPKNAIFSAIGGITLLNCTRNLEKKKKSAGESWVFKKIQWRRCPETVPCHGRTRPESLLSAMNRHDLPAPLPIMPVSTPLTRKWKWNLFPEHNFLLSLSYWY